MKSNKSLELRSQGIGGTKPRYRMALFRESSSRLALALLGPISRRATAAIRVYPKASIAG